MLSVTIPHPHKEAAMSTTVFLLVLLAIGVFYLILFKRMEERRDRRKPREENPIRRWLTGKRDDED